jgi:hypothetical protein
VDPLLALASLAPDPKARDWRGVSFTAFCRELKVTLEPGQQALAMVAYDGCEPMDLPPELREFGRRIFGDVDVIPPEARRVVCIVAGARGGKSYVFGALRLLHLALTVSLATMAPGEDAIGTIFSGDPRQREQCFKYVLGAARSCPGIASLILGKARTDEDFSGSEFTLKRPDGKVTIESLHPKPGGGSGRGRSLVGAVLEECAFFQDENHIVNDVDVFKAVTPRILPGGQTILSSTPWAEAGLLYDEFTANHPDPRCAAPHLTAKGKPHRAIAAHAPTLLLRDVPLTRDIVKAEEARDPENAAREYGAQFLALTASQFFDAVSIAQAVDESLVMGAARSPHSLACVGSDLGFVKDAAVGAAVERTHEWYALLAYIEKLPGKERLKPSQVFAGIAELARTYGCDEVVADAVYSESAREALDEGGVVLIATPGGNVGKAEIFGVVRHELHEGNLRLPNDPRLLQQLREVKKRPLPGGGYAIEQPRKATGGHGDIVSALVAGVWRLSRLRLPEIPEALPEATTERDALLWERRVEEGIERSERNARLEREGFLPYDD